MRFDIIKERIQKYMIIKNKLNLNLKNNCLKIYKNNKYRIGNNIILDKRIGSDSYALNGIVYNANFRDIKDNYNFACRISIFKKQEILNLKIQEKLTNLINKCPHFPLFYGYILCNPLDYDKSDSFIKSDKNDISIKQENELLPILIQNAKNENKQLSISFLELADGDFYSLIKNKNKLRYEEEIFNAIGQMFIAIMFYYQEIKIMHTDTQPGNFLYHKIEKGGYFYYKIFGKKYYLKNIGYLWIINDFEMSLSFKYMEKFKKNIMNDFLYLLHYSLPFEKFKWYINPNYHKLYKLEIKIYNLFYKNINDYKESFNIKDLKKAEKFILNLLVSNNILLTKINRNEKIINNIPYEIQ